MSCHKFLCLLRSSTSRMRKARLFKSHKELKSLKSNSCFAVVAVVTFVGKIGRKTWFGIIIMWYCSFFVAVYNSHSTYSAILEYNLTNSQYHVIISLSSLEKTVFPPVYLPAGITFHKLRVHPHSMNIFIIGEELWFSSNLGATFERILKTEHGVVSYGIHNSRFVFSTWWRRQPYPSPFY